MRSLKGRLGVVVVGGAGILLVVGALALRFSVASWLMGEFDRVLEAKTRALVGLTEQDRGVVELDFAGEVMPEFESRPAPGYFELWVEEAGVNLRSPSLAGADLPREPLVKGEVGVAEPRFWDLDLPDGRSGRAVQIDFVPRIEATDDEDDERPVEEESAEGSTAPGSVVDPGSDDDEDGDDEDEPVPAPASVGVTLADAAGLGYHTASLVVASSREDLDRQLGFLDVALAIFVLAMLGAVGVLLPLALGVGLRPLGAVVDQVERLDADRLDARIDVPSLPTELAPLVGRLNDLLDRLHGAFDRERRFSSNVAHELRTPLAELRSLAEVGGRWPDDEEAVSGFFRDVNDIAGHMERMVVHLLALTRHEGGIEEVLRTRVPLAESVERAWAGHASAAAARSITCDRHLAANLIVDTDRDKLELMLSNLFSNAVAYSPAGSNVVCSGSAERGSAVVTLEVTNPTDELEPADLDLVFDRFWRKDESRAGGHHLGLGMSLVKAFSDLLGIELSVSLSAERRFRVVLRIPRGE